jgi:hypothetical protein
MLRSAGHAPTRNTFLNVVHAALKAGDVLTAVETIMEMEHLGDGVGWPATAAAGDLSSNMSGAISARLNLHHHLVAALVGSGGGSGGARMLDRLYFALLDQMRSADPSQQQAATHTVSRVVLGTAVPCLVLFMTSQSVQDIP